MATIKQTYTGDSIQTIFNIPDTAVSTTALTITLDGVVVTDYTTDFAGDTVTFTTAPTGVIVVLAETAVATDFSVLEGIADKVTTSMGSGSLTEVTTGINNTAVGVNNQINLTTSNDNTSVGYNALNISFSGSGNTAIGSKTGEGTNSASNNTFVGAQSNQLSNAGSNNSTLGYQSGQTASDYGGYSNTTSLGYRAKITSDNQVQLGDANVLAVYSYGSFVSRTDNISNLGSTTAYFANAYVNKITMKSPNGTVYAVTVDDTGVLVVVAVV